MVGILPLSGLDLQFTNLHRLLRDLYDSMMPLCKDMISFAAALAALGALFYIAYRVWQSRARAEPLDVFALLRPFCLGLCILFFDTLVIGTLNGILSPLVVGTNRMLQTQLMDMKELQEKKDRLEWQNNLSDMTLGIVEPNEVYDKELLEMGLDTDSQGILDKIYEVVHVFSLKHWVLKILRWLLEFFFGAAALVVDTLRTYYLVILSVLGPVSFAFAVFDGFQASLMQWLTRYISIYLWLPVADLLSTMLAKIQVLSLERDIELIGSDSFLPDSSNSVFMIVSLVGIIGYLCVPSIASWIVQSSGAGAYQRQVGSVIGTATSVAAAAAGASTGNVSGSLVGNAKK